MNSAAITVGLKVKTRDDSSRTCKWVYCEVIGVLPTVCPEPVYSMRTESGDYTAAKADWIHLPGAFSRKNG